MVLVPMTETALPACPICGRREGFTNKAVARGPAESYYNQDGERVEVWYDNIYFQSSPTVRCAACHSIRTDVQLANGRISLTDEDTSQ